MGVRGFLIGVMIAAGVFWAAEYGSAPGTVDSGAFRTAAMAAVDPSDREVAAAARIAMQDWRPEWESTVGGVDYYSGILRVALRMRPDDVQTAEIADAFAAMVRSPDARLLWSIKTVEITDGLGAHIAQLSV